MPDNIDQLEKRFERVEHVLRALSMRDDVRRNVLITGGTGTLGCALTEKFLALDYDVTVINRDAHKQVTYQARYPKVRCILTDICNYDAVLDACIGKNLVIHAAALKHVDIGETAIAEFQRVNIDGTRCVADAIRAAGVEKALFISSDKAVSPLNFYGMTKAVGERIWSDHNLSYGLLPTRFATVRYGNVMGSSGSVLDIWRSRLALGQPIVVREPETTRFFMPLADAVQLVFDALRIMQGGEIFVPTLTAAFALYDLAQEVAPRADWQMAPLGPREKEHELLLAQGEYFTMATNSICCVKPELAGKSALPDWSCSRTAKRLTGAEIVAALGG